MRTFVVIALLGAIAQLIDGALGMAYGVTSTTLLLAVGTSAAVASASVHLSEVGTSLVSGIAHWRLGNVDWRVVRIISIPGGIGAIIGAYILGEAATEGATVWVAVILLLLGLYVLVRFLFNIKVVKEGARPSARFLIPLGAVAGFVDATGGGGWGPIATPTLIASGRLDPRRTVGSIDTAEFVVAICASIGFLASLGTSGLSWVAVGALLAGGVVAAPFAAWLVRLFPPAVLGTLVGGIVILTNTRTLLRESDLESSIGWAIYGLVLIAWTSAVVYAVRKVRRERAAAADIAPVEEATAERAPVH